MLRFANYEKQTVYETESDTWLCSGRAAPPGSANFPCGSHKPQTEGGALLWLLIWYEKYSDKQSGGFFKASHDKASKVLAEGSAPGFQIPSLFSSGGFGRA